MKRILKVALISDWILLIYLIIELILFGNKAHQIVGISTRTVNLIMATFADAFLVANVWVNSRRWYWALSSTTIKKVASGYVKGAYKGYFGKYNEIDYVSIYQCSIKPFPHKQIGE